MEEYHIEVEHGPDRETNTVVVLADSYDEALDEAEVRAHELFGPRTDIHSVGE